jgi:hypothetical protein
MQMNRSVATDSIHLHHSSPRILPAISAIEHCACIINAQQLIASTITDSFIRDSQSLCGWMIAFLRNVGLPYARLAVPSMNMRCEFIDDGMLA